VFGLTVDKLAVVALIAVCVIGPERLPLYAGRLASAVRMLRGRTDSVRERVRAELGSDFDDVEWKKLDPRQYDPRRIIREALVDEPPSTVAAPADVAPADVAPADVAPRVRVSSNGRSPSP